MMMMFDASASCHCKDFRVKRNYFKIFTYTGRHHIFPNIIQSAPLLTVSKNLVKLTKTWYRGTCGSKHFYTCLGENILLVAPLSDYKPLCDSEMTAGQMFQNNLFSKTQERTFPITQKERFHGSMWWVCVCIYVCTPVYTHSYTQIFSGVLYWFLFFFVLIYRTC